MMFKAKFLTPQHTFQRICETKQVLLYNISPTTIIKHVLWKWKFKWPNPSIFPKED